MTGSSVSTSPPRCTQCVRHKDAVDSQQEHARNLIVCIDGTSNHFGQNNTNVVKLFAKIDLKSTDPKQYAFYSSGIGTRPKTMHILNRIEHAISDRLNMAVAWNMEEIVKEAYAWLARMYKEGDQIYLFGFSRGAYQVRVLAGMIHEVGLIRTITEKQIGMACDHYKAIRSGDPKTRQIAREFKNTFSWKNLRVHFVGVWDTVSSVGLIKEDVFLSTSASAAHACHFRHALALDELRVKFMPEYFHEMNIQMDHGNDARSESEQCDFALSDDGTEMSECKKTSDIKEVWFAGCHGDVGGTNRPGKSRQAGNVSLLWMRREAAAQGLALEPTDIVWVPEDLDFGISDSMSTIWRLVEYMPIKHQVSFSGTGEHARRLHRLQPRRIIAGQKVHASILFANAYKPHATRGEGLGILVAQSGIEDTKLDDEIWETGMFDDTAAQELLTHLGTQQGVSATYLDRLLFMLRFKEGKQCVRNVPHWQSKFVEVIKDQDCAPLVRVVTAIAYHEASCDSDTHSNSCTPLPNELSKDKFDAEKCLSGILAANDHHDGPRVLTLLRPLTKHPILRERILTQDVLENFMKLLDAVVEQLKGPFAQAMDGLNCLLQCDDTREKLFKMLEANPTYSVTFRLSQMLKADDSDHLTAALRMILTLARIPKARVVWAEMKPRIRELAGSDDQLVGLLAIEILLALYDPKEKSHLNIRDTRVRANLANVLVHLNPNKHDPNNGVDPGQLTLRYLFGLDAEVLDELQKGLIRELKRAVVKGNGQERTAATMTLLKLCDIAVIRPYLHEIKLLDVIVEGLQHENSALLAAYALVTCLNYSDMKECINNNQDVPKYIIKMLKLDYFDDAIGRMEGFQIFRDLMEHDDLRDKIMKSKSDNITDLLYKKLRKGNLKEIRTSLICLGVFRTFDKDGPWTHDLVEKGVKHLTHSKWRVQKAGVAILSALAQTGYGVAAIKPCIPEIVEMLLPQDYPQDQSGSPQEAPEDPTFPSENGQTQPASTTTEPTNSQPPIAVHALLRRPSELMGPACTLRALSQNGTLRSLLRQSTQYDSVKHLYLSGTLVHEKDTSAWRVFTPNRADVINMLEGLIKTVDGELSEDCLMSIEDAVPPNIEHWTQFVTMLEDLALGVVIMIPALLGTLLLAILTLVAFTPAYLSITYDYLRRLPAKYPDSRISHKITGDDQDEAAPILHQGENGHVDEGPPGVHGQEDSRGVEGTQSPGGEEEARPTPEPTRPTGQAVVEDKFPSRQSTRMQEEEKEPRLRTPERRDFAVEEKEPRLRMVVNSFRSWDTIDSVYAPYLF